MHRAGKHIVAAACLCLLAMSVVSPSASAGVWMEPLIDSSEEATADDGSASSKSQMLRGRVQNESDPQPDDLPVTMQDRREALLKHLCHSCFWYPTFQEILSARPECWKNKWKRAKRYDYRPFWGGPSLAYVSRKEMKSMVQLARAFGIELE